MNDNLIWLDCNTESLIYLKFVVEKQIETPYYEIDFTTQYYVAFIGDNPTLYYIFAKYNENIKTYNIKDFKMNQSALLKEIDICLILYCEHSWINKCHSIYDNYKPINFDYCLNCHMIRLIWLWDHSTKIPLNTLL